MDYRNVRVRGIRLTVHTYVAWGLLRLDNNPLAYEPTDQGAQIPVDSALHL
jgi:hypothetical protein